jgi:hypothetical protein
LQRVRDDESDLTGINVIAGEDKDGRGKRDEVANALQSHRQPTV